MDFLRELTTAGNWKKCQFPSADQPLLNWLVWSGRLKAIGVKYEIKSCCDGFFTLKYCSEKGYMLNENGMLEGCGRKPLMFIHQYNRFPELAHHFSQLCPLVPS
jgi:hypothetical protein